MRIRFESVNKFNILFGILLAELVLGGSGHLLHIGPLSIRMALFLFIGVLEAVLFLGGNKLPLNRVFLVTILFLCCLIARSVASITVNPAGNVADEFTGYLPLLLTPFFGYCFYRERIRAASVKSLFLLACLALSLVTLLLWAYCLLRGVGAYGQVELGFLRPRGMGRLAFSGRIPRLFMKGTVFCCIAFLMCFYDWLRGERKLRSLAVMGVCIAAVLVSFTLGLYIAVTVGALIIVGKTLTGEKRVRVLILLGLAILAGLVVLRRFNVMGLMQERFSGDYTLGYKFHQTGELLRDMAARPLFGNGAGHVITIDYGYTVVSNYRTENMWGEVLNHYGAVGFLLFLSTVAGTCLSLGFKTKRTGESSYFLFALGVLVLAVESLSNPFLNNAIGLTFLSICIGMTLAPEKEQA